MLEVYKDKQSLFYEEVINIINNNKVIHAYMIETNDYEEKDELINLFIKTLFCSSIESKDEINNICNLIDNDALSDFTIIEPDGSWIKKEQILEIKEKFKTTSFNGRPRIYLIKQADKLNKQASNSLLKFLEEPDGNIIAILEVDNRYKVLETIRSRCQIYTFINHNLDRKFINFDLLLELIKTFENKKYKSIAYLPIVLENDYRSKEFWVNIFSEMIDVYENAIRKLNNINYNDFGDILEYITNLNNVEKLIYKINVLFDTISYLDFNLNINMMLDKFKKIYLLKDLTPYAFREDDLK